MTSPIARHLIQFRLRDTDASTNFLPMHSNPRKATPSLEDNAEKLRVLEERTRQEMKEIADREREAALALQRMQFEERLAFERRMWVQEEAEKLSSQWIRALQEIEGRLAESVAQVIAPFLSEALRKQVLDELKEALAVLLSSPSHKVISISGPQDMLLEIEARLGQNVPSLEYVANSEPDIRVVSNGTVIETQLNAWIGGLLRALKSA